MVLVNQEIDYRGDVVGDYAQRRYSGQRPVYFRGTGATPNEKLFGQALR